MAELAYYSSVVMSTGSYLSCHVTLGLCVDKISRYGVLKNMVSLSNKLTNNHTLDNV
jgi:hypothetical protein